MNYKFISADEAAQFVNNGDVVSFSGFTPAGAAKAVPTAIAKRAIAEHEVGKEFKIGVITGASHGPSLFTIAKADAVLWRTPYQSNTDLRNRINSNTVNFFDQHLSHTSQYMKVWFRRKNKICAVEAWILLMMENNTNSSCGTIPMGCQLADKIIVELNKTSKEITWYSDIYLPAQPPYRREIPIYKAL